MGSSGFMLKREYNFDDQLALAVGKYIGAHTTAHERCCLWPGGLQICHNFTPLEAQRANAIHPDADLKVKNFKTVIVSPILIDPGLQSGVESEIANVVEEFVPNQDDKRAVWVHTAVFLRSSYANWRIFMT